MAVMVTDVLCVRKATVLPLSNTLTAGDFSLYTHLTSHEMNTNALHG